MYFEFSFQLQSSDISQLLSSQGFGGYLGLKMLTATDQMFKCAAVMAPITDFKLYSEFQLRTLWQNNIFGYFWSTFFEVPWSASEYHGMWYGNHSVPWYISKYPGVRVINSVICNAVQFLHTFLCVKLDSTLFSRCCLLREISRPSN